MTRGEIIDVYIKEFHPYIRIKVDMWDNDAVIGFAISRGGRHAMILYKGINVSHAEYNQYIYITEILQK